MCELLAVSNSQATRLTFSLHTLASRGGDGSTTRDGWGVAFYEGADVALFREPAPAGNSALVRYLETEGPSTTLAISHIRHATQGSVQHSMKRDGCKSGIVTLCIGGGQGIALALEML